MRVLSVIHYPVFGGPHNRAIQLADAFRRLGWVLSVVVPDEPGNAYQRLSSAGIDVMAVPLSRLRATRSLRVQSNYAMRFWPDVRSLRAIIRNQGIDVIWIGGLANPHGAIAGRKEGAGVVWQLLDTRLPAVLRAAFSPVVSRLADVVECEGTAVQSAHPGITRLGNRVSQCVPTVDTDLFRPGPGKRARARAILNLNADDIVIGTVGNVNPQKGHKLFVRAAAELRRTMPDAKFVILGAEYPNHAEYAAEVRTLARESGLTVGKDLILIDAAEQVPVLAQSFDLFWMTSEPRSEAMGTAVCEAMSLQLPVVATDVGSVGEAVRPGRTGLMVPPHDAEALAKATLSILQSPDRGNQMGRCGRAIAEAEFATDVSAAQHARAFEMAAERAEKRRRVAG